MIFVSLTILCKIDLHETDGFHHIRLYHGLRCAEWILVWHVLKKYIFLINDSYKTDKNSSLLIVFLVKNHLLVIYVTKFWFSRKHNLTNNSRSFLLSFWLSPCGLKKSEPLRSHMYKWSWLSGINYTIGCGIWLREYCWCGWSWTSKHF